MYTFFTKQDVMSEGCMISSAWHLFFLLHKQKTQLPTSHIKI